MVMMALPTMTNGLRARSDRFGGGGTCSGSNAARGLRGELGGRSLIDPTRFPHLPVSRLQPSPRSCGRFFVRMSGSNETEFYFFVRFGFDIRQPNAPQAQ